MTHEAAAGVLNSYFLYTFCEELREFDPAEIKTSLKFTYDISVVDVVAYPWGCLITTPDLIDVIHPILRNKQCVVTGATPDAMKTLLFRLREENVRCRTLQQSLILNKDKCL
jgi:hypothetical protein